jgi:hypothetical protein
MIPFPQMKVILVASQMTQYVQAPVFLVSQLRIYLLHKIHKNLADLKVSSLHLLLFIQNSMFTTFEMTTLNVLVTDDLIG